MVKKIKDLLQIQIVEKYGLKQKKCLYFYFD